MLKHLAACLLLTLGACKTDSPTPQSPSGKTVVPAAEAAQVSYAIGTGPTMAARTQGVPHSNNIDQVALSSDGTMAMSRDSLGGVRFWPSLDGSAEPMLVPLRGARDFSVARSDGGATIAAIDGASALHVLRTRDDGNMHELFMSSPHTPIRQAEVLRGGEHILILASDHKISLLDAEGNVLSEVQERRFRPQQLRLTADQKTVMAISSDSSAPGMSVSLQALALDREAGTLTRRGDATSIDKVFHPGKKRMALSPDGAHLAFLGLAGPEEAEKAKPSGNAIGRRGPMPARPTPSAAPSLMVADIQSGEIEKVELSLPAHEALQIGLGFVANDTVVITSRPSGGSWRVQLGEEIQTFPLPSAVANDTQRSAHAFAQNLHLAADGTWLFVQKPLEEKHHYLGYGAFDPQFASLSPDASRVVWTHGAEIYVESTRDEARSVRITAPPTEAYFRAVFLDDKHIAAIDYSGGVHLLDWKEGKEVASLDTGGAVRDVEVDQDRKLIRGVRSNGGTWLCELGKEGLLGPYLVQDQSFRSGFLDGEDALWTIDSQNRYHTYSLADLRAGLSAKSLSAEASPLEKGAPVAINQQGQHYFVKAVGSGAELSIEDENGADAESIELPWTPMQTVPSPDGSHVALLASSGAIVNVYERSTGKSLWSVSFVQGVHALAWSQDSKTIAVASQVGAVVYDAATGKQIRLGCGPRFQKRATPPTSTVSFLNVQNLCER